MNTELLRPLVVELATKLNKLVNIPFVDEKQEQAFFEMLVLLVLDTLLGQLQKDLGKAVDRNK